jgi:hypothetical protein
MLVACPVGDYRLPVRPANLTGLSTGIEITDDAIRLIPKKR